MNQNMFHLSEWKCFEAASLVGIAVVGGDDLPGEDGLQQVEVVGEPREEGAVEVAAGVRAGGLLLSDLGNVCQKLGSARRGKGASRYDVRKILGFFDPLPLVRIWK